MRPALLLMIASVLLAAPASPRADSVGDTQSAPDGPLQAAFERYLDAQRQALDLYRASAFFNNDRAIADAYRGVLQFTIGSIKAGALLSYDHPRFARYVDWTSKAGLENPDNNYYQALLADDGVYRITGNRGSHAQLIFQLVIGQPGVGSAGSSTNVAVLDNETLIADDEGNFEIVVSRERPDSAPNWIQSTVGAETLIVRATFNDWLNEEPPKLVIERIDQPLASAAVNSSEAMAHALDRTSQSLVDRTRSWLEIAENMWQRAVLNQMSAPRPTPGGLVGQYSAYGSWDLAPDEALVIAFSPDNAPYVSLQLGSLWFTSLDYETRVTSLNQSQMACSATNVCTIVIAGQDPGVANWLDTAGFNQGLLFMRWQGLRGMPEENNWPRAKKITLSDLSQYSDDEVPRITPEARREQIRGRMLGAQRRFGG